MDYDWSAEDVNVFLQGAAALSRSSFEPRTYGDVLLSHSTFLAYLLQKLLKQHQTSLISKRVISKLRWLISRSYDKSTHKEIVEIDTHSNGIDQLIKWFPTWTKNQIQNNLDKLCLKIEKAKEEKTPPEIVRDNKGYVTKWLDTKRNKSFFIPHPQTGMGKIQLEDTDFSQRSRYSLVFDKKERVMYFQQGIPYLSLRRDNVCLTVTFKCGSSASHSETGQPQFIINDFTNEKYAFRGVSAQKNETGDYRLCVHGVDAKTSRENCMIIAESIEEDEFYTLQIVFGNEQRNRESFFTVYKDASVVVGKTTFKCNKSPTSVYPYLTIGGRKDYLSEMNPDDFFSGAISNIELMLNDEEIPSSILKAIIVEQTMINPFSR